MKDPHSPNWPAQAFATHVGSGASTARHRVEWRHALKRALDLTLCLPGALLLGALLPIVALAIVIDSRGPVFYTQVRVGRNGRLFHIYKFRTMVTTAAGGHWTRERDVRVTRVGRVLRSFHLDELPQFVNVLKGEMSAVGPRPESPEVMGMLIAEDLRHRERLRVRPGMAGLAFVEQGYVASIEDALQRLEYDLQYIEDWSLWLDFRILARSVVRVLRRQGR